MIYNNDNKISFIPLLVGLSAILLLYPYTSWGITFYYTLSTYVLLVSVLLYQVKTLKEIKLSSYLFLFVFYLVYSAVVGYNYLNAIFESVTTASIVFLLYTDNIKQKAFLYFCKILSLIFGVSLLFYLLRFAGIYKPELVKIISPDGRFYYKYFANVLQSQEILNPLYLTTGIYRFYSILDEPGFLGSISALILCSLKFNLKKYKFLIVFLITSIFSFSLASYITCFLFLILYFSPVKFLKFFIPVALFTWIFLGDVFEQKILNRLQFTEEGGLSGENRTNASFDREFNKLLSSPEALWGKGKNAHSNLDTKGGVSSWKSIVYNGGIIGFFIYLLIFTLILLDVRNFSKFALIFFLVFMITVYHRPNIQNIYYLIILFGGLLIDKVYENKKNSANLLDNNQV